MNRAAPPPAPSLDSVSSREHGPFLGGSGGGPLRGGGQLVIGVVGGAGVHDEARAVGVPYAEVFDQDVRRGFPSLDAPVDACRPQQIERTQDRGSGRVEANESVVFLDPQPLLQERVRVSD